MDYKAKTIELLIVRNEIANLMLEMHEVPLCINGAVVIKSEKEMQLYNLYNSLKLHCWYNLWHCRFYNGAYPSFEVIIP